MCFVFHQHYTLEKTFSPVHQHARPEVYNLLLLPAALLLFIRSTAANELELYF